MSICVYKGKYLLLGFSLQISQIMCKIVIPKQLSHGLKLNENDPISECGGKERGDEASVDVEKSTS